MSAPATFLIRFYISFNLITKLTCCEIQIWQKRKKATWYHCIKKSIWMVKRRLIFQCSPIQIHLNTGMKKAGHLMAVWITDPFLKPENNFLLPLLSNYDRRFLKILALELRMQLCRIYVTQVLDFVRGMLSQH